MEKRNELIKGVAIGLALCLVMYFYMLWAGQHENSETRVMPYIGKELYVTIDDGTETYQGEAVVVANDETTTVIQMGGKVYVASTKNVVYE